MVDESEILILGQTIGELFGIAVVFAQGKDPEDIMNFAGVDISLFELGKDIHIEPGAMRAAGRGIFDKGYFCIGIAQGMGFVRADGFGRHRRNRGGNGLVTVIVAGGVPAQAGQDANNQNPAQYDDLTFAHSRSWFLLAAAILFGLTPARKALKSGLQPLRPAIAQGRIAGFRGFSRFKRR